MYLRRKRRQRFRAVASSNHLGQLSQCSISSRLSKFWKGLRSEIPWVADPPTTIIRDRVRLTLQPFDAPSDTIPRLLDHIGSDEMLLFSTDYPHFQFEATNAILAGIDPGHVRKIMVDNPRRTYLRLQETVQ